MKLEDLAKDIDLNTNKSKQASITQSNIRRPWLEEQEKITIIKGELKKPNPIEKELSRLEKIEIKTDKLIQQSANRNENTVAKASPDHSLTVAKASSNRSLKINTASYVDFLIMKGIKKVILKEIEKNIFKENSEYFSFIDTEMIKKENNIPSNILRDAISKLKKENWFEPIKQHYTKRLVKIEIQNYKKHTAV